MVHQFVYFWITYKWNRTQGYFFWSNYAMCISRRPLSISWPRHFLRVYGVIWFVKPIHNRLWHGWPSGNVVDCTLSNKKYVSASVCSIFAIDFVLHPFFFVFKHVTSLSPFWQPTNFAQKLLKWSWKFLDFGDSYAHNFGEWPTCWVPCSSTKEPHCCSYAHHNTGWVPYSSIK